jgi:DNA-binding transcriptional MerR regulator
MSNPRISVSQLKQMIQLRSNGLSMRNIARALSLSQGAVSKYCRAVLAACGTWEAALALEEAELEEQIIVIRSRTSHLMRQFGTFIVWALKSFGSGRVNAWSKLNRSGTPRRESGEPAMAH